MNKQKEEKEITYVLSLPIIASHAALGGGTGIGAGRALRLKATMTMMVSK